MTTQQHDSGFKFLGKIFYSSSDIREYLALRIAVLLACIGFTYSLFFTVIQNPALAIPGFGITLSLAIAAWYIYKTHSIWAQYWLIICTNSAVFYYAEVLGKDTGIYYFFFAASVLPFVLFSIQQRLIFIVGIGLSVLGFLGARFEIYQTIFPVQTLPLPIGITLNTMTGVAAFVIVCITVGAYSSSVERIMDKLFEALMSLKKTNDSEHKLRIQAEADVKTIKQQQRELNIVEAGKLVQDKMFSTIPAIEGLTISAFSKACMGVSGDFYFVKQLADGSVAIFLADVAGKGVPAALNTTLLYRILTHMFKEKPSSFLQDPALVFNALHTSLCEEPAFEKGLPAFLGVINPTHLLTYAVAGLGDVYICRKEKFIHLHPLNGMLHVTDVDGHSETYLSETFQLESGDVVYIFTDGYTDTDRRTWKTFIPTDDNHIPDYAHFQSMHTSHDKSSDLTRAEHVYTWWKSNIADNIEKLQDDTTVVAVEVG